MALNSINTNIAAYSAQSNIGRASGMASSSIARLSSGNRIVQASDDVAAMSSGTSLRTNVTTLRRALINTSQGSSLLQVADGALSQVTDILQRQKAIAVQASGGTLTGSERSFLNQEFQNLTQEIDRLATQTNFNGVSLLNGALSEKVGVADNSAIADRASMSITWSANIFDTASAATKLVINGTNVTFDSTAGTGNVDIGATLSDTLDNAVRYLNSSTDANLSQATYKKVGNSLVITAKAAGAAGENFRVDSNMANSTALSATGAAAGARTGVISGQYDSKLTNTLSGITVADVNTTAVVTTAGGAGIFTAGAATTLTVSGNAGTAVNATSGALTNGTTLKGLVDQINANTAASGVTARIGGYSGNYSIIFERGYNNANETTVAMAIAGAAIGGSVVNGTAQLHNVSSLNGATETGLGSGRTSVAGTVGNSLVTGLTQTTSKVTISFPDIANSDLLTTANFGTQRDFTFTTNTDTVKFGFVNKTAESDTEVKIGGTLTETLDNFVAAFNKYQAYAGNNFSFQQVTARREGNSVVLESKAVGDANDIDATAFVLTSAPGISGVGTIGTFANGDNSGGVDVTGVTNKDFIGKVGGFKATYTGTNDKVNLEIKVGDNLYTATVADTTPGANTLLRFSSQDGGGYFDVYLAANQGTTVASQANADTFGDRLNAAFASLNFSQNRSVASYKGNDPILTDGVVTGSLIGTSLDMKLANFDDVKIDKVQVLAPSGSNLNASISITVNGETFTSPAGLGGRLGNNGIFKLTSTQDATRNITFKTGDTAIDISTQPKADSFEAALKKALGVGDGSSNLLFQVGTTTSDTLSVAIGNIDTDTLFKGASVDVLTQENALKASDVLDAAIKTVTSVRADVGALQSRFNFASANIESSIQNQDAARGTLLDTDVASEATAYATAQVQLQAGIAVLAQANQLPQNLLKLIG